MRIIRLPSWGLRWYGDGSYYFARWAAHVGPFAVLVGT